MTNGIKSFSVGPFRGINNRLSDFELSSSEGDYVRFATNVDLDDAGHFRRRDGQTLIQALSNPHSLFQASNGRFFVVIGSALYRITLPAYTQTLVKVLANNDRVFYVEHNGDVFFSNGVDSGRIDGDDACWPWALPTPDYSVIELASGVLPAGRYLLAVTYSNADTGEEGGAKPAFSHALMTPGGLRLTLPAAVPGATHLNIYVSACNGAVPCLHGTVPVGTTSYDILSDETTRACLTIGLSPLPAGTGVFFHLGRLGAIVGPVVYYSEPWRAGYCRMSSNFVLFEESVSLVVPAQVGCYIVADKTRWFAGDLNDPSAIVDVLPYSGVPGTAFVSSFDMGVGWFGGAGIVLASPDGQATAVMADNVDLETPESGAAVIIEANGYRKVIACGWALNLTTNAATKYENYDYTAFAGEFGTKSNGIYQLSGTDDYGTLIDAQISLGRLWFGTLAGKRVPKLRLGVDSSQPMAVTVTTPDHPEGFVYSGRWVSAGLREQQVLLGRGLASSWYEVDVANTDGADFVLAHCALDVFQMTRRV